MKRWLAPLAACLAASMFLFGFAAARAQGASRHVALVIGNGAYEQPGISLVNPPNDARDVAAKLGRLGYRVIEAIDVDFTAMQSRLVDFTQALDGADAGIFFYAGHGMEYAGKNYLLPTDARLDRVSDVRLRLIDVDDVMWALENTVPTRIVILDACRDNPLALELRAGLPSDKAQKVGRGLVPVDTAAGSFVAFSTAPGDVAADGTGRNSPFTKAMLANLDRPGLDADALMREVRNDVIDATDARQVPFNTSSLRAPFVINDTGGGPVDDADAEALVWQSIVGSEDPDLFAAYLERFGPDAPHAASARAILTAAAAGRGAAPERLGPFAIDPRYRPARHPFDDRRLESLHTTSMPRSLEISASLKPTSFRRIASVSAPRAGPG